MTPVTMDGAIENESEVGTPPPVNEVSAALQSFTTASRKVEDYYRMLEERVRELGSDLERTNRELRRRVLETERMQALLFSMLQSLTCGVVAVGREGVVVAANPPACKILGRDLRQVAGKRLTEVLLPIPGSERLLDVLLEADGAAARCEWTRETTSSGNQVFQASALRAQPPHDFHLAGLLLLEEITELRRLERRSALQNRLAGIGELTMNLAHEIRNPLGSISLFATSLECELEGNPSLQRLAKHLVAGVNSIEHIVSNALEFTQPRRLAMSRIDLAEAIEGALVFIEHPRRQKAIRLELDLPEAAAFVTGDGEQLRQVFLNVVINALQAMGEGGTLRVSLAPANGGWQAVFADDGAGIAKADLDRIFDPFFTTKEQGSGIGLAIAHRILAAHGAQIEVESQPGKGASFRIYFPSKSIVQEDCE